MQPSHPPTPPPSLAPSPKSKILIFPIISIMLQQPFFNISGVDQGSETCSHIKKKCLSEMGLMYELVDCRLIKYQNTCFKGKAIVTCFETHATSRLCITIWQNIASDLIIVVQLMIFMHIMIGFYYLSPYICVFYAHFQVQTILLKQGLIGIAISDSVSHSEENLTDIS